MLVFVLAVRSAMAAPLECVILKKYSCTAAQCQTVPATIRNTIDLQNHMYSRCDSKGCDSYVATISQTGVMVTLDLPGRGAFARMNADGSEFVEVVSLLTNTLISYGTCR
jgi:hypothetical protein